MTDLLKVRAGSERASRRKRRGEAAVDFCADFGLLKKTKNEAGFLVQGNNLIPELKTAYIEAPAGMITVFGTYSGMKIFESDYFAGPVYFGNDLYVYDHVLKKYFLTGIGENSTFTLLLQGQPERMVLIAAPYSNVSFGKFVRNVSYCSTEPIGQIIFPGSFLYPNSWPTTSVFPTVGEEVWVNIASVDLIYNNTVNACKHHETLKLGHLSGNRNIGGVFRFTEQYLGSFRPSSSSVQLPVSSGYREFRDVRDWDFFFDEKRYYGTCVEYSEEIFSYSRVFLENIIYDGDSAPETHNGATAATDLKEIILTDADSSIRPAGSYTFSALDGKPIIFNVIDLTTTMQDRPVGYPLYDKTSDQLFFDDNEEERKWRISCHWHEMDTGLSWSFTADQFWDLLRERVKVVEIDEDWRTAASIKTIDTGWHGAVAVLEQWLGRLQHAFTVPHDTWTFHAEDDNIYAWSRYYGNIMIDRTGIHGLEPEDILVPDIVTNTDGIRPTIRYSGFLGDEDNEQHRYVCVCEKLERFTADEDVPEGPKKIYSIHLGSPFIEDGWDEVTPFVIESEEKTWSLIHARVVYHKVAGDIESIMLLGVARERYLDEDEQVVINYYSCYLKYDSLSKGNWLLTGKYSGLDATDPLFGESLSVDLCLFGDSALSPEMMKYPSPPVSMSQVPLCPYDTYYSGLP